MTTHARQTAYSTMLETLSPRASRKIANNTYMAREDDDAIRIRLHGHAIVSAAPNGVVTLDQCGWPTLTTRDRLNTFLADYAESLPMRATTDEPNPWRYKVATHRKVTSLYVIGTAGWTAIGPMPAAGPVTIGPRGAVRGLESPARVSADARLRAQIKRYAQGLPAHLPLPMPSGGDCWYCAMFDGAASPAHLPAHVSTDHLREHLRERYYVPSLVWNALLYNGCQPNGIGAAYFVAAFGDIGGFPRERVVVMLQHYLERCLKVA